MQIKKLFLSAVLVATLPVAAQAKDQDFFIGVDVLGGVASGSSSTKNGGGVLPLFNGDGVVDHVHFGEMIGIGGHIGYRLNPTWSATISYQHFRGDVRWDATFPTYGGASGFDGKATSNVIIGHIAYTRPLSEATSASVKAGLGVAFNRLSKVAETDMASGLFVSDLAAHTKTSPTAQIGLGIEHKLTPGMSVGLDAAFAYAGGFETGNTRSGNLGVTSINPYKIDDVWRGTLGASLKVAF